ncbi:MAG: M81 family metallopeptidase [Ginsengibacter sp.]
MTKKRVCIAGIAHESNTFSNQPTTLVNFEKGHLRFGNDIIKEFKNAFHEIGGMLQALEEQGIEAVPVFFANAVPGGIIESETYQYLLQRLLQHLEKSLPFDGCLLVPHGAGVSEHKKDMDGHWLSEVRKVVGSNMPIVTTLDLHANVSHKMIEATNAMISYRNNPHIDQRERGKEAAALMASALKGKVKPVQSFVQLPLAISIEQQCTSVLPLKEVYDFIEKLRSGKNVLSVSLLLGFPYADVEEMGTSIIVVTDNDKSLADGIANELGQFILERKKLFFGQKKSAATCIAEAASSAKPVLILDMGDNVGGGAPGNTTEIMEVLEADASLKYFVCLYHPKAVNELERLKPGEDYKFVFQDMNNDITVLKTILIKVCDGAFQETIPMHGGQANYDMGRTAILKTKNGSIIMLQSVKVPPFSLQQLIHLGIVPEEFDVLVAKGVIAPIAAYQNVCKTIIQANTKGVTQADMRQFEYKSRRKPMFPFEEIS